MDEITIDLPEILHIPHKLLPIITEINKYRYFLLDGGRAGGKTQSVGRLILYIGEQIKTRIVCGREVETTIEESVHALLKDLIDKYHLNYRVQAKRITHRFSKTNINFRRFGETGNINVKGLEGVKILWIDEAQTLTKSTIDLVIPTVRDDDAKFFFTLNRFLRDDPICDFLLGRPDCLHIKINYDENEFCPSSSRNEANICKQKSEADYRHIWLGEPLDKSIDYLFSSGKIEKCKTTDPYGELFKAQRVMSVDIAAAGAAKNIAGMLERQSALHWKLSQKREWSEPDTDMTIGKIIALYTIWKPDLLVVDCGGLGYPIWVTISKTIPSCIGFDGAGKSRQHNAANQRTDGYFVLNDFVNEEWLICTDEATLKQMGSIKKVYKRNGDIYIQSKEEMRNEKPPVPSPDSSDMLMMAMYAIRYHLGKDKSGGTFADKVERINKRRDRR